MLKVAKGILHFKAQDCRFRGQNFSGVRITQLKLSQFRAKYKSTVVVLTFDGQKFPLPYQTEHEQNAVAIWPVTGQPELKTLNDRQSHIP